MVIVYNNNQTKTIMSDSETQNWPDLAISLYDKLTGRNAKINYNFIDFKIGIPKKVGSEERTDWTLNGTLSITTSEQK